MRRSPVLTVILALAALCVTHAQALRADDAVLTDQTAPQLAQKGEFDELLKRVSSEAGPDSPRYVALLTKDLERYLDHHAQQTAKRRESYDKALADLDKHLAEERIDDALLDAIEAYGLADDAKAFLASDRVNQLVDQSKAAAEKAEKDGQWLDVLNLYRKLNYLFEVDARFLTHVKDAERHVRVLRLYAPKALEAMLKDRARARLANLEKDKAEQAHADKPGGDPAPDKDKAQAGDDPNQPIERKDPVDLIDLGDETWKQRLEGVEVEMLKEGLLTAGSRHVDNRGYKPLMVGMIDALGVLIDTPQIVESFPTMADAGKVLVLRGVLRTERTRLDAMGNAPDKTDAMDLVERLLDADKQTLQFPTSVMAYEMMDGALSELDDFTAMIWPQELEQFSRSFSGTFYGVGIQISKRDGQLIVVSPLADTPAFRAGIKAGDVIATVDGVDTSSWSLDKAVRMITGPEGTPVTLGIDRVGEKNTLEFKLKRAEIPIESIRGWQHRNDNSWDYYVDPDFGIGYVRLSQFIPQSASDLDAALEQMRKQRPLNALVLDLRFNPGGLLTSAIEVSNRFVASGPIVSTVDMDGKRTSEARARPDRVQPHIPVVVLINQGSASASEIVSGALQDHHAAIIVGENSFGKGSVQDLFRIDDAKAYLKLTTQYYMLPGGRIIHRRPGSKTWGIQPDLEVKMTTQQVADSIEVRQSLDILRRDGEELPEGKEQPKITDIIEKGLDPQLEAALLVLKTQIAADQIALAAGKPQQEPAAVP
ncbi:MAG: PDZ domain-containing protein [Phycisphaera sp.]|nr:PDZ domain-containing protein [Phycisphaera sp.]